MLTTIIDNRGDNTLKNRLEALAHGGTEIAIASAFFSLDALALLADTLTGYERIRLLFGDDADRAQRLRLLHLLRERSDADLLQSREALGGLSALKKIEALMASGRVEARCYTQKKFHAKAYLVTRPTNQPPLLGVLGSGNFTRAGLTQNIELNAQLNPEQTEKLSNWFEERWDEAVKDPVTEDILAEIRRQIDLYQPHLLYLKALLLWGGEQQDGGAHVGGLLADKLDPHQEIGFRQALRLLSRQSGVMVCDGVGLGKSFIALALMEWFCRRGERVLLIAPKAIINSSWNEYLTRYLARYTGTFGSIAVQPMTYFGFDPKWDSDLAGDKEKQEQLAALAERADVIVIDESHNFRTPSSSRYKNLAHIVQPDPTTGRRKKMILLTATPINTAYADLAAQTDLVTSEEGSISGMGIGIIKKAAQTLDKEARDNRGSGQLPSQLSLDGLLHSNDATLRHVLEQLVIQRSRKTCRELAYAAGKELAFPTRREPEAIEYGFDGSGSVYRDAIRAADTRFRPGVELYRRMKAAEAEATAKGKPFDAQKLSSKVKGGIKLAAFLPGQYRLAGSERHIKEEKDEIHLAGLVFTNTLKQLESSPVAFQGILQSLALGLTARVAHILKENAEPLVTAHRDWVQTPLFPLAAVTSAPDDEAEEATDDLADDGDAIDLGGDESDGWLNRAIGSRGLERKFADFGPKTHDVSRWASDIAADLGYLKKIHAAIVMARKQEDPKLVRVVECLRTETDAGRRVLVFTQSQRTAQYLEREVRVRLATRGVARIDSRVSGTTRPAILHAFCPGYNPPASSPSVPARVDVLISTDVLSEGVNLQEAGAILNYDIHWNPVRLIQRIGRVDRRLNPDITPRAHAFGIFNVLPPPDIESIIDLVGKVEERTLKISRTLGLDVSFFKATDRAGTLNEFNAAYEGDLTASDHALKAFVRVSEVDPPDLKTQAQLDALPPGAFGVWQSAPENGVFALYTLEAKTGAPTGDINRFASLLGRPVLAQLRANGKVTTDAGEILYLLSATVPGHASGTPSDEPFLANCLKTLRNAIRQSFRDIDLPATIAPRLVCWMELKKECVLQ